jgi:hypothetical protein
MNRHPAITLSEPYPLLDPCSKDGASGRSRGPSSESVRGFRSRNASKASPFVPSSSEHDRIEWDDYPRIKPGEYRAYCVWGKQYQDRAFRRWVCLLRWDVFSDDLSHILARVPFWLSLGNRNKPHASRRGKYLSEWIRANSGPPSRNDRLSPQVFLHRFARVEIGDTEGKAPYSAVKRIVAWETGSSGHSVSKSHSQGRQVLTPREREASKESLSGSCSSALAGVEGEIHSSTHPRGGRSEQSGRPSKAAKEGTAVTVTAAPF